SEMPASLAGAVVALPAGSTRVGLRRRLAPDDGWFGRLATVAIGAVAVVLVVGGAVVLSTIPGAPTLGPVAGGRALTWRTDVVTLEADSIVIEVSGQR